MNSENSKSSARLHRNCSPEDGQRAIEILWRIRKAGTKKAFQQGNTPSEVMKDVIDFLDRVFGPDYPFHD